LCWLITAVHYPANRASYGAFANAFRCGAELAKRFSMAGLFGNGRLKHLEFGFSSLSHNNQIVSDIWDKAIIETKAEEDFFRLVMEENFIKGESIECLHLIHLTSVQVNLMFLKLTNDRAFSLNTP